MSIFDLEAYEKNIEHLIRSNLSDRSIGDSNAERRIKNLEYDYLLEAKRLISLLKNNEKITTEEEFDYQKASEWMFKMSREHLESREIYVYAGKLLKDVSDNMRIKEYIMKNQQPRFKNLEQLLIDSVLIFEKYLSWNEEFKEYRQRVVDKLGYDPVDKEFPNNLEIGDTIYNINTGFEYKVIGIAKDDVDNMVGVVLNFEGDQIYIKQHELKYWKKV